MLDITTRPPVNGIDLAALDETVAAVSDDPRLRPGRLPGQDRMEGPDPVRNRRVESYTLAGEVVPRSFTIVADEPHELLGTNTAPNPQELLMSAVNACMMVGYVAQAAVRGITLDDCRIETEGELDLRGFLGLDESVPPGYRRINYTVFLEGDGTREQYEEIHQAVMATSPNYFNMAQPIQMVGRLA